MDGLIVLALIVWAIAQASKKNKKRKAKAVLSTKREILSERSAKRAAQQHTELPKQETMPAQEMQTFTEPVLGEGESVTAFARMEPAFRGSMQMESTEGECICDPELGHEREQTPAPASVYENEIGREPLIDFSAKDWMRGVVMSEILAKPAQRTRRVR